MKRLSYYCVFDCFENLVLRLDLVVVQINIVFCRVFLAVKVSKGQSQKCQEQQSREAVLWILF